MNLAQLLRFNRLTREKLNNRNESIGIMEEMPHSWLLMEYLEPTKAQVFGKSLSENWHFPLCQGNL